MSGTLPQSVVDKVMFKPFEDIGLRILRDGRGLPDIASYSWIPFKIGEATEDFILVRRGDGFGNWSSYGDPRFIDYGDIAFQVFTEGPEGDKRGALISEGIRVTMQQAAFEHWYWPDLGAILKVELQVEPIQQADFQDSAGPVQYADLPNDWWRYESIYQLWVRKPNPQS